MAKLKRPLTIEEERNWYRRELKETRDHFRTIPEILEAQNQIISGQWDPGDIIESLEQQVADIEADLVSIKEKLASFRVAKSDDPEHAGFVKALDVADVSFMADNLRLFLEPGSPEEDDAFLRGLGILDEDL